MNIVKRLLCFCLLLWNGMAEAQTPDALHGETVHYFALLVGSNLPGDNQAPLRYAHKDVDKMRRVLLDIGRHRADQIEALRDPSAKSLTASLRRLKKQIMQLPDASESRFVFYYSGHAKSNGITLGKESVSLEKLRQLLNGIPSSQKIIVLDACQSGSFSRVKGVRLAKDFSHNSMATLQTRGTAVLASSSAEELSQESDALEGSIFTHNFVAGLRGAADADTNGRVSLYEAYDYAYNNTLVATADTRVGKQHVTLETDIKGSGETVLTWPEASSAKLVLPMDVQGTVVIFEEKSRNVHAEIHKAKGSDVLMAFPPGRYGVLMTDNRRARQCAVTLKENAVTTLQKNSCRTTALKLGTAKDDSVDDRQDPWRWTLFWEMQAGIQFLAKDDFIHHLESQGYRSDSFSYAEPGQTSEMIFYGEILAGLSVNRYVSAGLLYSTLDRFEYGGDVIQDTERIAREYKWQVHRFNVQLRLKYPLWHDRFVPHAMVDAGAGLGKDEFRSTRMNGAQASGGYAVKYRYWGPVVGLGIGMNIQLFGPVRLLMQWKYVYAPVIENLYDDKQNGGGWIASAGLQIGHIQIRGRK